MRIGYELPSFGTLLKIAEREHEAAERAMFQQVEDRLTNDQRRWLDELLIGDLPARQTLYNVSVREPPSLTGLIRGRARA